jgi:hypothetical protein
MMRDIAFVHLYVAALMRELSLNKVSGDRIFPLMAADELALSRNSFNFSMTSGFGSFRDDDTNAFHHCEDGNMPYEGDIGNVPH